MLGNVASLSMSEAERREWDRRYAECDEPIQTRPSPFLEAWLPTLPPGGRALDVACGAGRNALRLAEAGYEVDAVDISAVAVARGRSEARQRGLDLTWHVADLDDFDPGRERYQVIVVIRYRNRDLWPRLIDALALNGWLLAEHHFKTPAPVTGPSETFKLEPQELLRAFGELRVILFEDAVDQDPDLPTRTVALERIVACNGDPGF